jgi:F-type H+-transporting ATPase subunit epsilon
MADKLAFTVVTPERRILSEAVDEVVLPSVEGYMGVLPGHAPLLALLDVGEISYRSGTRQGFLAVSGGYVEVQRDSVEVLAETCEPAQDIDVARAQSARARAEAELQNRSEESQFKRAELSLKRAISRIQIAGRAGLGA